METLRKNIIAREIRITLLCMFYDILPIDIINIIIQFTDLNKKKSESIAFDFQIKKAKNLLRPNDNISNGAIKILNNFINAIIAKFIEKSMTLTEFMRQKTISSRTIQAVVRLLTSGKYQRKLVSLGTRMVTIYYANICEGEKRQNIANTIGTIIGPARVEKTMRINLNNDYFQFRITNGAPIYLVAVIDNIVKNIIKISGNNTIYTDDIINAVKNNSDLKSLYHELFI